MEKNLLTEGSEQKQTQFDYAIASLKKLKLYLEKEILSQLEINNLYFDIKNAWLEIQAIEALSDQEEEQKNSIRIELEEILKLLKTKFFLKKIKLTEPQVKEKSYYEKFTELIIELKEVFSSLKMESICDSANIKNIYKKLRSAKLLYSLLGDNLKKQEDKDFIEQCFKKIADWQLTALKKVIDHESKESDLEKIIKIIKEHIDYVKDLVRTNMDQQYRIEPCKRRKYRGLQKLKNKLFGVNVVRSDQEIESQVPNWRQKLKNKLKIQKKIESAIVQLMDIIQHLFVLGVYFEENNIVWKEDMNLQQEEQDIIKRSFHYWYIDKLESNIDSRTELALKFIENLEKALNTIKI